MKLTSKVVGSYKTFLGLPTSDIDIMIDHFVPNAEIAIYNLSNVLKELPPRIEGHFTEIKLFTSVKRPFLRVVSSAEYQNKPVKIFFDM